MKQVWTFLLLSIFFLSSQVQATPALLTYQGRILRSDGTPLQYHNVSFIFQITDPGGSCIIYQEQVSGYDMTHSKGLFDTAIGSGTRSFPASGVFSVLDSLKNGIPLSCQGGSSVTLPLHAGRLLRVSFWDGSGWKMLSPDSEIRTVPYAGFANGFTGLLAGDVSGTQSSVSVDKIKGVPVDLTGNSSGKVLAFDGTKFTPVTPASGSGGSGTVTSVAAGTGLLGGTISITGTLSVDVGTTTGKILQVGVGDKLPSVDGSNLTNLNASHISSGSLPTASLPAFTGDVTSSAGSNSLTLATVPITKGGTGATSQGAAINNLLPSQFGNNGLYLQSDGTNVSWAAPTLAADSVTSAKILDGAVGVADLNFAGSMTSNSGLIVRNGTQFFNKSCNDNEMLIWTTSNGWSCSPAPSGGGSGTVTSITAGTGLNGGSITTSGTISISSGGVTSTELAANSVITAKINDGAVTAAKLETVSGLTAGVYGSSTLIPSITVDNKGRVTAISTNSVTSLPSASGASGQYLKSNGTSWAGADIRFSDIKNSLGASAFNTNSCDANQTVKWSSLTDMFECQNIGSLDASAITGGTIASARLPAGASMWQDGGSSRIHYSAGNVGIGTATPETGLDVDQAMTLRKAYFEKVGDLGALSCGATNITGYATNIYTVTACASGTTTLNIPTITGWPAGSMSWNVTFFVTGQTASVFNISYNGATSSVYWDKNSTGGSGGASYSGFAVNSGTTSIISCLVMNSSGVKVYCGVAAQY
ncbi:hypothetical protein AZI86_10005 [Bdellovibrio bacteriovorus]|uniref:Cell wall surface anchor family protein n=1 Tax=Bdellovibrio bacteriovorus TaxID=959 RepID=A0A150WS33_BDEBC|nr:hypothetical protein [Bdellovibrio bacteriovorus]KYG67321.1 hypothetical protein AZI86_10005 [Bdellovibrio bacteriovorus]